MKLEMMANMNRTGKAQWFLDIALRCAQQGTCMRRNFGAVVVDKHNTIVSTGYTGAPHNMEDCTEIGWCWREQNNIPSGQSYEKCRSVHAEQNALIQAGKNARGSTMYLAGFEVKTGDPVGIYPCFLCAKMIVNSGIESIVVLQPDGSYETHNPSEIYDKRLKEALDS
jgi:dCMP deaminase